MSIPDFYLVLGVDECASAAQIRTAYQRLAIVYHPDVQGSEVSAIGDPHERFQELADAYYVLSDPTRRRDYDLARSKHLKAVTVAATTLLKAKDAEAVFYDAFQDLLKPEVEKVGWVWWASGGVAGGTLGFIVANVPGALVGSMVGGTLGKIRDRKGKSVAEVFLTLGSDQRQQILVAVAKKLLA